MSEHAVAPNVPLTQLDVVVRSRLQSETDVPWWVSESWLALYEEWGHLPIVAALEQLAGALCCLCEPEWVTGGDGGPDASVRQARRWLDQGVAVDDIQLWFRSGCWSPEVAGIVTSMGLRPDKFLDDNLAPFMTGHGQPLLEAVRLGSMLLSEALQRAGVTPPPARPSRLALRFDPPFWVGQLTDPNNQLHPPIQAKELSLLFSSLNGYIDPSAETPKLTRLVVPRSVEACIANAREARKMQLQWTNHATRELERVGMTPDDAKYVLARLL